MGAHVSAFSDPVFISLVKDELPKLFKEARREADALGNIMAVGLYRKNKIIKLQKHFSRKPRKRFSYNDYVVLYNSMMCKGKLNCSEHTKREWYKKQCKLHYADQYDELDFIRKTLDNRLIV